MTGVLRVVAGVEAGALIALWLAFFAISAHPLTTSFDGGPSASRGASPIVAAPATGPGPAPAQPGPRPAPPPAPP